MSKYWLLFICLPFITVMRLEAADATLGKVTLKLPTPKGFCDLSESDPSDRKMLSTLTDLLNKSGNKLLGMSADCQQLTDWRSGKRQLLDDYAQYQVGLNNIDKPTTEPVKKTCETLRAEGSKILAKQLPDLKARVESTLKNIKVNESLFLGVLGEEPNACYAGLMQRIRTELNTDKTQITVFAVSTIKERSLFTYRFTVYQGPETADLTLKNLKKDVAAVLAANR